MSAFAFLLSLSSVSLASPLLSLSVMYLRIFTNTKSEKILQHCSLHRLHGPHRLHDSGVFLVPHCALHCLCSPNRFDGAAVCLPGQKVLSASNPPLSHVARKKLAQRCEQLLMGVPGDHDGPICPADHWHATPARHTQAVTSSGASAESLSQNLLIRLLNSSNTCYAVPRPCPCHGVKNTFKGPACIFFLPLVGSFCGLRGSPFHLSWVLACGAGEKKSS